MHVSESGIQQKQLNLCIYIQYQYYHQQNIYL